MSRAATLLSRYRIALLALALSAALHAAVMVGMPKRIDAIDDAGAALYSATLEGSMASLDPEAPPAPQAAPAPARPARSARPKRARKPPPEPEVIAQAQAEVASAVSEALPAQPLQAPEPAPAPEPPPPPEVVALAAPATPIPALEPEKFPASALPASLSIEYQITSAFADGRATYQWQREGDSYRISGEAAAEGFFTLFLEGTIVQESRGSITATGLRPERFSENRPGAAAEGLEFDWNARKVTFDRKGGRTTSVLSDNTVDWLSMIFQLAHAPPKSGSMELRVFTQRKLYRFELQVLGEELIDIPLGNVRALHLRHVDKDDKNEAVDVWLGVDQHYLPVKLRYPVARNRLVVEQVATRVTSR
ncbi:MAG TPA: DUF3108 domain-containing protein [Usitatibacter sp.]|nr:DUF3108 domain-containing protein [Usitatibacter sp.]